MYNVLLLTCLIFSRFESYAADSQTYFRYLCLYHINNIKDVSLHVAHSSLYRGWVLFIDGLPGSQAGTLNSRTTVAVNVTNQEGDVFVLEIDPQ